MPAASIAPTPAQAWARLAAHLAPLPATTAAPADAVGLRLAAAVASPIDLPPFTRSAMDGVAVASGAVAPGVPLPRAAPRRAGTGTGAGAGTEAGGADPLPPGHAAPIATGAPLPPGADAVVPREAVRDTADGVVLLAAPRPGDHVRRAGEDARRGTSIAAAGDRLTPARVGLLAAAGVDEVVVVRRPRVVVVVTGDEVRVAPAEAGAAGVPDANGPALRALLADDAAEVDVVHAPDEPDALRRALAVALTAADVTITTGGASVGAHDHVRGTCRDLGLDELLWGVAVRPGAPTGVARRPDGRVVLALPGNPTAAHVVFLLLGRPLLRALAGDPDAAPVHVPARLAAASRAATGRVAYVPASLTWDADARLVAMPAPVHGAARAVPLAAADALARLPPSPTRPPGDAPAGTVVGVLPLDGRWPTGGDLT